VSEQDRLREAVIGRKVLFCGGYLRLEELTIRLPDGRDGRREVVTVANAVAVLPVDADGRVHLVRQHRAAIGRTILEAPAGVIEPGDYGATLARKLTAEAKTRAQKEAADTFTREANEIMEVTTNLKPEPVKGPKPQSVGAAAAEGDWESPTPSWVEITVPKPKAPPEVVARAKAAASAAREGEMAGTVEGRDAASAAYRKVMAEAGYDMPPKVAKGAKPTTATPRTAEEALEEFRNLGVKEHAAREAGEEAAEKAPLTHQEVKDRRPHVPDAEALGGGRAEDYADRFNEDIERGVRSGFGDPGAVVGAGSVVSDWATAKYVGLRNYILTGIVKKYDVADNTERFISAARAVLTKAGLTRKSSPEQMAAVFDAAEGVATREKLAIPGVKELRQLMRDYWKYHTGVDLGDTGYMPHMRDLASRPAGIPLSEAERILKAVDEGLVDPWFLEHREDLMKEWVKDPYKVLDVYFRTMVRFKELQGYIRTGNEMGKWFTDMARTAPTPEERTKYLRLATFMRTNVAQVAGVPGYMSELVGGMVQSGAQLIEKASTKSPKAIQRIASGLIQWSKETARGSAGDIGKRAIGIWRAGMALQAFAYRAGSVVNNFVANMPPLLGAFARHPIKMGTGTVQTGILSGERTLNWATRDALDSLRNATLMKDYLASGLKHEGSPGVAAGLQEGALKGKALESGFIGLRAGDQLVRQIAFFGFRRVGLSKGLKGKPLIDFAREKSLEVMASMEAPARAPITRGEGAAVLQGSIQAVQQADVYGLPDVVMKLTGGKRQINPDVNPWVEGITSPRVRALGAMVGAWALLDAYNEDRPPEEKIGVGFGLTNWRYGVIPRIMDLMKGDSGAWGTTKKIAKAAWLAVPKPFGGALKDFMRARQRATQAQEAANF